MSFSLHFPSSPLPPLSSPSYCCHPHPIPVTPVKTGAQGNRQDLGSRKCREARYMSHVALGPRFRGGDNGGNGDGRKENGGDKGERSEDPDFYAAFATASLRGGKQSHDVYPS